MNKFLIYMFMLVSIFITGNYTFNYGLQTSILFGIVFLIFGVLCDYNKSMLPEYIIESYQKRLYMKCTFTIFSYLLLLSFSFYSSYASLELAAINQIKNSLVYKSIEGDLKRATVSYDKYVSINYIDKANKEYKPLIDENNRKLQALLDNKKSIKLSDIIKQCIFALIIELSILTCHINTAIRLAKTKVKIVKNDVKTISTKTDTTSTTLTVLESRLRGSDHELVGNVSQNSLRNCGISLSGTKYFEFMTYLKKQGKSKRNGKKWELTYTDIDKKPVLKIVS